MRKFTSLLTTLLCLSLATPAMAQLEELDHNVITIGAEAESITPDTQWYLVYNSRGGGGYWWDKGFRNEDEGYGVVYMSEGTDEVVWDGMTATAAAEFMVRFLSTDEEGKYYVQFGTGNYIWTPATWNGDGDSGEVLESVPTIEEASTLYGYCIADTPGHFGFNTTDGNLWCVDQNGQGGTVVIWSSGVITSTGGNNDFAIYPVDLTYASDWEMAYMNCMAVYQQYVGYSGTFTTGTGPGCYGEAEVAAFEAALATIAALDSPDVNLEAITEEEYSEMSQAVVDAYAAVIASYISKQTEVAEGYYLFTCGGLDFTETTEDEETPDGEIIPGEEVVVAKGMYSELGTDGNIYALWKTAERTCPFLWKITANGDKTYEVVSMATDATFNNVSTSTNVTMAEDSENLMVFDYIGDGANGDALMAIRVSTQAEDDYYYLHCGGHSNGAGVSGNIVGWNNEAGASLWILEAVSEEEAQAMIEEYAPTKDAEQRYVNTLEMISDAKEKMAIAEDVSIGTEELITSVDQLSSPYTEESEGSIEALLDGDTDTFWHSNWSDGSVDAGTHYLQVELNDTYEDLVFVFTRRNVSNDHITLWGVYGAPTADADKDNCTFLAEISTPFGSSTETLTSAAFNTAGFTILRFYINDTYGSSVDATRGYGHMSEFQLYTATANPTSQKVAMGDIYTNLENAIATAEAEDEDITAGTYNTLKAAYDAFIAVFVDPAELRATLAEASTAANGMVIGTNPGEWSDASSATALNTTVGEATTYDAAGVYTQTQSDNYVETLTSQMAAIMDAANKVETGKWYEIRFATEEEIEANGWSLSSGAATETQPDLYGKYMTVGTLIEEDGVYSVEGLRESDLGDICVGHSVYFQDKMMDILDEEYAKFRFVSVGDTAYVMQNKATGLFLKAAGTSGGVTLSVHPSLFNVSAIGYGENLISAETLDGEMQNNLHAQRDYNQLVTWESTEAGSNSGLYIEDIDEAVASDYDGTDCNLSLQYGAIYTLCYPVEMTTEAGTIYGASVDGTTVTLAPMEGNIAPAGVPFVFISGDEAALAGYEDENEEEPVPFTHGYNLEKEAKTSGALVGTYYYDEMGAGKLIASGNEFVVSKSSSAVSANSAYINGEYSSDDVIVIEFSDETFDSIEDAIATVAQDGNIYTIDGKLIGKGNLGTVKTLGKGIYIVNGAKVLVK